MSNESDYQQWLARKRSTSSSSELTDRIMEAVSDREAAHRVALLVRVGLRIEQLRLVRYAVCSAALLIGATPFLYLAFVAQLIVF